MPIVNSCLPDTPERWAPPAEGPNWAKGGTYVFRLRLQLVFGFGFILASALFWQVNLRAPKRPLPEERIGDGTLVTVLPPDAIPALTRPVFLSRAEAESFMHDDEPVLGLVDPVTGQARAYSLWHLERHEIVNDRLGGKLIAVTW